MSETLWTATQVARLLGVSTDLVYAMSRDGTIPTVRLGRYRRYRPASIRAWIENLEEGSAECRDATARSPSRISQIRLATLSGRNQ